MVDVVLLTELYVKTYTLIRAQTAGLTHAESLWQPPSGGNCLNWIVGHLTATRTNILALIQAPETVWGFKEAKPYVYGSAPITEATALPFAAIINAFERTQGRLVEYLPQLPSDLLAYPAEDRTIGGLLALYQSHEAYHAGQIESLLTSMGKRDVPSF
jgi:hypothetical protein